MDTSTLAIVFLAVVGAGGVAYVLLYPLLSGEARAEKRQSAIQGRKPASRRAERASEVSRRDQVAQSLKEMDERQKKAKRPSVAALIAQAGLDWSRRKFLIVSLVCAAAFGLGGLIGSGSPVTGAVALAVGGLGAPRFYLKRRIKGRLKAFEQHFPNALDVIVRGVKAGLPLGDCVRVIAGEAQEPVRGEFRKVIETQTVGVPLGEAIAGMYERMPCQEANFFGIVIAIQQKAGGSLSESLANLSKVLRERKKMRAKIKAVSTEAKASAAIIGSLPVIVMVLVYLTTPQYIALLWQTNMGKMMGLASAFWMGMGIMVMRKMINFEI